MKREKESESRDTFKGPYLEEKKSIEELMSAKATSLILPTLYKSHSGEGLLKQKLKVW